jgi:hypothetical protein
MQERFQLGFLAMLAYSSIAEIALTILSRQLQLKSHRFNTAAKVLENDKWFKSIIQATLGLDPEHRLDKMKWSEYHLTPDRQPFLGMFSAMEYLNQHETDSGALGIAIRDFRKCCAGLSKDDQKIVDNMADEITRVWGERLQSREGVGEGSKD